MTESAVPLRGIPQIDALVARAAAATVLREAPRHLLLESIREIVGGVREAWRAGDDPDASYFDGPEFTRDVAAAVGRRLARRHAAVINATGILLHTGLGRAPLSDSAIDSAAGAGRYAIVEVDPKTGERDHREKNCAELLCDLTGAEAATVVNNNAAAMLLVLSALARGREAIASRGELVEIGGGFRMPEVMATSGCRLVEVGTTNRTYARDFAAAITASTGVLLKIHTSNFRIVGFTAAPTVRELASLAAGCCVPFVYDLGSGLLRPVAVSPLEDEPTVSAAIAEGADVVCFSGDKLLCGPQAGLVVGRRRYIDLIRQDPLFRAVRPGKLDLAALEATLLAYRLDPADSGAIPELPLYRQLATTLDVLGERAERVRARVGKLPGVRAEVVSSVGFLGSGSAPAREIPGVAITIRCAATSPERVATRLRSHPARVHARIVDGALQIEFRSVFEDQLDSLIHALLETLSAPDARSVDA